MGARQHVTGRQGLRGNAAPTGWAKRNSRRRAPSRIAASPAGAGRRRSAAAARRCRRPGNRRSIGGCPCTGSLSSVKPPNFVRVSHAACTNSNCRAMLALRPTKRSPISSPGGAGSSAASGDNRGRRAGRGAPADETASGRSGRPGHSGCRTRTCAGAWSGSRWGRRAGRRCAGWIAGYGHRADRRRRAGPPRR